MTDFSVADAVPSARARTTAVGRSPSRSATTPAQGSHHPWTVLRGGDGLGADLGADHRQLCSAKPGRSSPKSIGQ